MKDRPSPAAIPDQVSTEHHTRCPICGHLIDEFDLEEVQAHLEPEHAASVRQ